MIDGGQLLGAGVFVGLLAAFWSRLRELGSVVLSRLVVRAELDGWAGDAVQAYAWKHFRRASLGGARRYATFRSFVRPVGRQQDVVYEGVGREPLVFWHGWRPVVLKVNPQSSQTAPVGSATPTGVYFLRGTFDLDALLRFWADAGHDAGN